MEDVRRASIVLHERILQKPATKQTGCALLTKLPPEIRTEIFTLALESYPRTIPEEDYHEWKAFARPGYPAPLKTDTAVLRTCLAIYQEYWAFPFFLHEQVHWAVKESWRCPPTYNLNAALKKLRASFPLMWLRQESQNLRVFAQLYMLEKEGTLNRILNVGLRPQNITITIRHTDWWNWENGGPLRLEGNWTRGISRVLPASVRQLTIELESASRMKEQVDELASQMMEKWLFRRSDGVTLSPHSVENMTWSGTNLWCDERWRRYGTSDCHMEYYLARLYFRWDMNDGREYVRKSNNQLRLHNPAWRALPVGPMNNLPPIDDQPVQQVQYMGSPRYMRDTISSILKKRRP